MIKALKKILQYSPILLLILVWEFFARWGIVRQGLLPTFSDVALKWYSYVIEWENIKKTTGPYTFADALHVFFSSTIVTNAAASLWRGAVGFSIAVVLGVSLGIAMAWFKNVRNFFEPLVVVTYPIPKPALIPVFIIWLGLGHISKIAVIIAGCIIPVVISAYNGARGVDHYLIWSALNMGTSPRKMLWRIIIPAALPDILSGIRMGLAISFIMLISSEMLAARSGLGYLIFFLGESGEYAGMFAAVLTVTLLGFLADRLYLVVMRRTLIWREE